jgi:chromatin remodeling complex protein RSC6
MKKSGNKTKNNKKETVVEVTNKIVNQEVTLAEENNEEENQSSDKILNQFETIIDSLSIFRNQINLLQSQLRNLEKSVKKEVKTLKKAAVKNKNKGNRKPSGFANPTKVSKELCEFMNKEEGSQIARTEVTKAIISYIKNNNLQNKTNKKIISPDEKLKFLLGIKEEEELTYFNLQKYMNKHFNSASNTESNLLNQDS